MPANEQLLREFDEEFGNTRKFLALIPDDKLMWKPHEKSMELGRLAWHLADFPEWTIVTFTQEAWEITPEDGEKAMRGWHHKIREDILARFDGDLPVARAVLQNVSEASLAQTWTMKWQDQTIIEDTRENVYRKWSISHMIHHRAQLGVYLRLLGIAIPGCYGPSADEMVPEQVAAD